MAKQQPPPQRPEPPKRPEPPPRPARPEPREIPLADPEPDIHKGGGSEPPPSKGK